MRLKKFLLLLIILVVTYMSWPLIEKQLENTSAGTVLDSIKAEFSEIDKADYAVAIDSVFDEIHRFLVMINDKIEQWPNDNEEEPKHYPKPELTTPEQQIFSIFNIELGDPKQIVEKSAGMAKRASLNEYGLEWIVYHDHYHNFFMVSYDDDDKVVALYTNQDLISSTNGIKRGSSKEMVREKLGKPLSQLKKETVFLTLNEDDEFDVFLLDDSYVTIFYDKHQNNTVSSLQIIKKKLEHHKQDFYSEANPLLLEGFEYQLFDLTNATRVNHKLPVLTWSEHVKFTAREHSLDMANNHYFNHTNLEGQSPFDRMKEDNIIFSYAGENLAFGQFSSIFAHEGLMNSEGHRENILRKEFEYLGVGVAFNSESKPYYTENFFTD